MTPSPTGAGDTGGSSRRCHALLAAGRRLAARVSWREPRPTQQGAFLPDPATGGVIQRDAAQPGQGLVTLAPGDLTADALRIPMPNGADGVMLIVYQTTDSGFENLLELPLILANKNAMTTPIEQFWLAYLATLP